MKSLTLIAIAAVLTLVALACKKKPYPEKTLTDVYVESGVIKDGTQFTSQGAFQAQDPALGIVDSLNCLTKHNGYQDGDGYLYIFENGNIPAEFKGLSLSEKSEKLDKAHWKQDFVYTLEHDAEVCVDEANWTYYVRESGNYPREIAEINGQKVYRYLNRYVVENYSNFLRFHEYLRPNAPSENLFEAIGIDPEEYRMLYNGKAIKGNALDYAQLSFTPKGTMDKILFEKQDSDRVKYRIRHIYVKHEEEVLQQYFCPDGKGCDLSEVKRVPEKHQRVITGNYEADVKANLENPWFNYLRNNVIPNYTEPTVQGYDCNACGSKNLRMLKSNQPAGRPPLPHTSNG